MRTIVCVLKSGGIYSGEWVRKLQNNVSQYMTGEYRFVCMSDMLVDGVETISFRHEHKGWWSKINLFEPGLFTGPTLYMDLDCLVVGDLGGLFSDGPFYMCQDFLRADAHNSSVMSWSCDMAHIYDAFRTDPQKHIHRFDRERPRGRIGDQGFIEEAAHHIEVFPPGMVVSYRREAQDGPPAGCSVVAFHGKPKQMHAANWARDMWAVL